MWRHLASLITVLLPSIAFSQEYVQIETCHIKLPKLDLAVRVLVGEKQLVQSLLQSKQLVFLPCECLLATCTSADFARYLRTVPSPKDGPALFLKIEEEALRALMPKINGNQPPPPPPGQPPPSPPGQPLQGQAGERSDPECRLTGEVCIDSNKDRPEVQFGVECPPLPQMKIASEGNVAVTFDALGHVVEIKFGPK